MDENARSSRPRDESTTPLRTESTERTPLIRQDQARKPPARTPTPLPKWQIATLLFLQLSEPVTSQSIYPFINELIQHLDVIKGDERRAGYYAGLLESLFFACEATTVLFWSHLSDVVGRRPVLFLGFAGLSVSMVSFGLSKTFLGLALSRCLAGFLNGYSGVIKGMMGEMTDPSNMAQAFAYIPVVWSVGATLGPFIGGALSRPAERFPSLFGNSPFWETYPYFLPCLVAAIFPLASLVVTLISLRETRKRRPQLKRPPRTPLLRHSSMAGSFLGHPTRSALEDELRNIHEAEDEAAPPLRSILTRRVFIAVLNYSLLSLIDIAFLAIEPVFYATSIPSGGLGLSPPTIGLCLGLYGMLMGIFHAAFFAKFHARLGAKTLLMLTQFATIPIFLMFPMINFLARLYGKSAITWIALCFQLSLCIFADMSGGCAFIYVTLSAPNRRSLGATNGLVAAVTAAIRAVGPAAATSLFAASLEHNLLHGLLVYFVLIGLVILAVFAASLLPDNEEDWDDDDGS
ncbi:MFS general substrate transporter [Fomitiporia mediterranea MF3/22]|uniref:MFS general substrate transporter n=1 Tax=Fomitiporia mediterranea (strain MF3/22) TaxID=694068 RepID=UPI0004408339|nr:MFS general substrate transporter [Fomitiporia mediterranea MF3/22]EJD06375.1 MFS general substrate transporter [Fomitiporia mediterranea MF3/22]